MAESCLDDLERWTSHTRAPWSLPLVERCHALLAEGTEAERRFEEALILHQVMSSAFDRARTQLLHGEFLRRARRRADARPHLRAAVEMFASVHAALWEERARRSFGCGSTVSRTRAGHRVDGRASRRIYPMPTGGPLVDPRMRAHRPGPTLDMWEMWRRRR